MISMNDSYYLWLKDVIDDYYKKAPWYDINGEEIPINEFIHILEEEQNYEEKSMGSLHGNGKAY